MKTKKSVLLVNQSSGYLAVDIANVFQESGSYENVVLATGTQKEKLYGLNGKISVQPIKKYNMSGTLSRFISWIVAFFQILFLTKTKYRGYSLFLVSNPPITSFLHLFCKNDYSTLIYDVYPDGLGNFASKTSLIYRLWVKNNISFYKKADNVFTLTESMKQTLSKYCDKDKIEVVPVWASSNITLPKQSQTNPFIEQHPELQGKFIVMYSGNIGLDHDLKCLFDAVRKIENNDIVIVIIGEGYNKQPLIDYAEEKRVTDRCFFYPYQTIEMLPFSLTSASVGVVATKPNGRSSSIPSKAFNLIQLQIPLMAIAHPESEISLLVKKHNIGKAFMTDQVEEIASFLDDASKDSSILAEYKHNESICEPLYTKELAKKFVVGIF